MTPHWLQLLILPLHSPIYRDILTECLPVTFIIIYPIAEIKIDQAIPYQAYHVNICQHGLSKTGDLRDPHWRCFKVPTAGFKRLGRRFLHCRGTEQAFHWWPEQPQSWQTSYSNIPINIIRYLLMDRWMGYPIWYIEYILRILYLHNIQMSGKCKWIEERLEFRPQRWGYHHQEWGKWFLKRFQGNMLLLSRVQEKSCQIYDWCLEIRNWAQMRVDMNMWFHRIS